MFWQMVNLFCINYETLLTAGFIMASMIIVLIGALKPLLFNKIKNECLRGSLLSFTNVAFSFGFVALAFWVNNISFDYYLFTSIVFCCFCIVLYWVYENLTQARAGIHKLGTFMWKKVLPIIRNKLDRIIDGLNDTKQLTAMVDNLVNKEAKKVSKKNTTTNGKDTKGL